MYKTKDIYIIQVILKQGQIIWSMQNYIHKVPENNTPF